MSWFPEEHFQEQWANLCQEFDEQSRENPFLSEEEKSRSLDEFNDRMTRLLLSYRYERIQAERSRK